ncbi:MAG: hypothetical protein C4518_13505 [Desulfobacteraceae bacterium]|nr:MAG: hypothetical protein C4518_13505 [Desulfobacteraceae bacterium]
MSSFQELSVDGLIKKLKYRKGAASFPDRFFYCQIEATITIIILFFKQFVFFSQSKINKPKILKYAHLE